MSTSLEALDSPRFHGALGKPTQESHLSSRPLEVSREDFQKLRAITEQVVGYIGSYDLRRGHAWGVDAEYLEDCRQFDQATGSRMIFGGLDLYKDPQLGYQVLEINAVPQFLGLQDFRLQMAGISNAPRGVDQLANLLRGRDISQVMVLGVGSNPYWRTHLQLSKVLQDLGFGCHYGGTQSLSEVMAAGFLPEAVIRFAGPRHILYDEPAREFMDYVQEGHVPVINSLAATFYGYRGFLLDIAHDLPQIFPQHQVLEPGFDPGLLAEFPWVKLEATGYKQVLNCQASRRWVQEVIGCLINRDLVGAERILADKDSGEAVKLREIKTKLEVIRPEEVAWVAQQNIQPEIVGDPNTPDQSAQLRILQRVYWIQEDDGRINISLEAFGCDGRQYSQSKGKINGGTGTAFPVVVGA